MRISYTDIGEFPINPFGYFICHDWAEGMSEGDVAATMAGWAEQGYSGYATPAEDVARALADKAQYEAEVKAAAVRAAAEKAEASRIASEQAAREAADVAQYEAEVKAEKEARSIMEGETTPGTMGASLAALSLWEKEQSTKTSTSTTSKTQSDQAARGAADKAQYEAEVKAAAAREAAEKAEASRSASEQAAREAADKAQYAAEVKATTESKTTSQDKVSDAQAAREAADKAQYEAEVKAEATREAAEKAEASRVAAEQAAREAADKAQYEAEVKAEAERAVVEKTEASKQYVDVSGIKSGDPNKLDSKGKQQSAGKLYDNKGREINEYGNIVDPEEREQADKESREEARIQAEKDEASDIAAKQSTFTKWVQDQINAGKPVTLGDLVKAGLMNEAGVWSKLAGDKYGLGLDPKANPASDSLNSKNATSEALVQIAPGKYQGAISRNLGEALTPSSLNIYEGNKEKSVAEVIKLLEQVSKQYNTDRTSPEANKAANDLFAALQVEYPWLNYDHFALAAGDGGNKAGGPASTVMDQLDINPESVAKAAIKSGDSYLIDWAFDNVIKGDIDYYYKLRDEAIEEAAQERIIAATTNKPTITKTALLNVLDLEKQYNQIIKLLEQTPDDFSLINSATSLLQRINDFWEQNADKVLQSFGLYKVAYAETPYDTWEIATDDHNMPMIIWTDPVTKKQYAIAKNYITTDPDKPYRYSADPGKPEAWTTSLPECTNGSCLLDYASYLSVKTYLDSNGFPDESALTSLKQSIASVRKADESEVPEVATAEQIQQMQEYVKNELKADFYDAIANKSVEQQEKLKSLYEESPFVASIMAGVADSKLAELYSQDSINQAKSQLGGMVIGGKGLEMIDVAAYMALPYQQQAVYDKLGWNGLQEFIQANYKLLEPYKISLAATIKDDKGNDVAIPANYHIVEALRSGDQQVINAVHAIYKQSEIDKATEGKITLINDWTDYLAVVADRLMDQNYKQIESNTGVNILNFNAGKVFKYEERPDWLKEIAKYFGEGKIYSAATEEEKAMQQQFVESLPVLLEPDESKIARLQAQKAELQTRLSEHEKGTYYYGYLVGAIDRIDQSINDLNELSKAKTIADTLQQIGEGLEAEKKGAEELPEGIKQVVAFAAGFGLGKAIIPFLQLPLTGLQILQEAAKGYFGEKEQRSEHLEASRATLIGLPAGILAFFLSLPYSIKNNPSIELPYASGMLLSPTGILKSTRTALERAYPGGIADISKTMTSSAFAIQEVSPRIVIPKGIPAELAREKVQELIFRWYDAFTDAMTEVTKTGSARDIVLIDKDTNIKLEGRVSPYQRVIENTAFHVGRGQYESYVEQLNKEGGYTVKPKSETGATYEGHFSAPQTAYDGLAWYGGATSKSIIIAQLLDKADFRKHPDPVVELLWQGKLTEAKNMLNDMARDGLLNPEQPPGAYALWKWYTKSNGDRVLELEMWYDNGFHFNTVEAPWYAKQEGINTAAISTRVPISAGTLTQGDKITIAYVASDAAKAAGRKAPTLAELYKVELMDILTNIRKFPTLVPRPKITKAQEEVLSPFTSSGWMSTLETVRLDAIEKNADRISQRAADLTTRNYEGKDLTFEQIKDKVLAQSISEVMPGVIIRPGEFVSESIVRSAKQEMLVIGDMHGEWGRVSRILTNNDLTRGGHWVGGDKILAVVGDLTDRGQQGIKVLENLKALQSEARAAGGNIITILGNHDAYIIGMAHLLNKLTPKQMKLIDKYAEEYKQTKEKTGKFSRTTATHQKLSVELSKSGLSDADKASIRRFIHLGGEIKDAKYLIDHPELLEWLKDSPAMVLNGKELLIHADNGKFYMAYGKTIAEVNTNIRNLLETKEGAFQVYADMNRRGQRGFAGTGAGAIMAQFGGTRIIHGHTPTKSGKIEVYKEGRAVNVNDIEYFGTKGGGIFKATEKGEISKVREVPEVKPSESISKVTPPEVGKGQIRTFKVQENYLPDNTIKLDDGMGGTAVIQIKGNEASIIDIRNESGGKIRTQLEERVIPDIAAFKGKLFEDVVNYLRDEKQINTVNVKLQSADSRVVLQKMVDSGVLEKPRDMMGVSTDRYPSTFDISKKVGKRISGEVTLQPLDIQGELDIVAELTGLPKQKYETSLLKKLGVEISNIVRGIKGEPKGLGVSLGKDGKIILTKEAGKLALVDKYELMTHELMHSSKLDVDFANQYRNDLPFIDKISSNDGRELISEATVAFIDTKNVSPDYFSDISNFKSNVSPYKYSANLESIKNKYNLSSSEINNLHTTISKYLKTKLESSSRDFADIAMIIDLRNKGYSIDKIKNLSKNELVKLYTTAPSLKEVGKGLAPTAIEISESLKVIGDKHGVKFSINDDLTVNQSRHLGVTQGNEIIIGTKGASLNDIQMAALHELGHEVLKEEGDLYYDITRGIKNKSDVAEISANLWAIDEAKKMGVNASVLAKISPIIDKYPDIFKEKVGKGLAGEEGYLDVSKFTPEFQNQAKSLSEQYRARGAELRKQGLTDEQVRNDPQMVNMVRQYDSLRGIQGILRDIDSAVGTIKWKSAEAKDNIVNKASEIKENAIQKGVNSIEVLNEAIYLRDALRGMKDAGTLDVYRYFNNLVAQILYEDKVPSWKSRLDATLTARDLVQQADAKALQTVIDAKLGIREKRILYNRRMVEELDNLMENMPKKIDRKYVELVQNQLDFLRNSGISLERLREIGRDDLANLKDLQELHDNFYKYVDALKSYETKYSTPPYLEQFAKENPNYRGLVSDAVTGKLSNKRYRELISEVYDHYYGEGIPKDALNQASNRYNLYKKAIADVLLDREFENRWSAKFDAYRNRIEAVKSAKDAVESERLKVERNKAKEELIKEAERKEKAVEEIRRYSEIPYKKERGLPSIPLSLDYASGYGISEYTLPAYAKIGYKPLVIDEYGDVIYPSEITGYPVISTYGERATPVSELEPTPVPKPEPVPTPVPIPEPEPYPEPIPEPLPYPEPKPYTEPKTYPEPYTTPDKYKPPEYKPTEYKPPEYKPPEYKPPAYTPPAYKPPEYKPPAYKPPTYIAPPIYAPVKGIGILKPSVTSFEQLTREQKLASISWKQGFTYHLVYPPYGPENVLHSRKPFPGVKVSKGPESAYRSVAKIHGEVLPEKVYWNLGAVNITFERGKKDRPNMYYRPYKKGTPRIRKAEGMPQIQTIKTKSIVPQVKTGETILV